MKVVRFEANQHYDEVCRWWKHHGWPCVPLDHLSDTGFVVVTDELEVPLCAGFLYFTGTAFAIFEWAVVNPTCEDRKLRKEALDRLVDFAQQMAEKAQVKTVFTSVQASNPAWISRLEKKGFTVTDSNMKNMIAKVGG